MIFYGIALSFKMQAIFILPFILVYYIMNKKFSIKHFMGTLLSIVVLSIPGCLNGRNIFDTLKVYIGQVKENPDWIFYNYPGISYLFTNADSPVEYVRVTKTLCLITALVVLGSIAAWVIYKKIEMSKYNFLYLAFLMTYAAVLFMPAMHERYGYVYEILAILLAIYDTKTIVGCIALQLCSVITYSRYLFGFGYDVRDARLLAVFNLLVFIGYFIYYIRKIHLTDKTVVTAYSVNRKE